MKDDKKYNDDPTTRKFLVTDGCQWEQNKQHGTFHPHAIEVVDVETGQTRYIKSGSIIQFIEGGISENRTQEFYNAATGKVKK